MSQHDLAPLRSADAALAIPSTRQFRAVLALIDRMAGIAPAAAGEDALGQDAMFAAAYAKASPVARRRHDALAGEAAAFAAAGLEALMRCRADRGEDAAAAAATLAEELRQSIVAMDRVLHLR